MGEKSKVLFSLFGVLDVTGEVVTMWIILLLIAVISLVVKKNLKERPGKFQNIVETGVEYLDNFFGDLLGKRKSRKYFTFLASLFIFIICSNYSGLIPGVGLTDYVKAPTASLSVTAGLGIMTFFFLQIFATSTERPGDTINCAPALSAASHCSAFITVPAPIDISG